MTLQVLIRDGLEKLGINEVAKLLGYSCPGKISARINAVIDSPYLLLDKSGFDFHYTTPELIKKLCEVLSIPAALCDRIITEIEALLQEKKNRFESYLFVETNFKRSSQPIFMLAALQSQRYLAIDDDIQDLPLNEQLESIQSLVKSHYSEQTSLQIWGEISQYVYFYDEQTIIVLSPSGEIIETVSEYFVSRATLSL